MRPAMHDELADGEGADGQAPDGDRACSHGSYCGGSDGDYDAFGSEREQSGLEGMIFCGHDDLGKVECLGGIAVLRVSRDHSPSMSNSGAGMLPIRL